MEKELYYINNKLIKIRNIYFDLSPSQFFKYNNHFYKIMLKLKKELGGGVWLRENKKS